MKKLKFKKGDLVYLKNVGFPFDKPEEPRENFEGASCTVLGYINGYVNVKPLILTGSKEDWLFDESNIEKENRPWLKHHLKALLKARKQLIEFANMVNFDIR